MPYSPPSTFTTKLVTGEWNGNTDALRVYLHEGIPSSDIAGGDWADTRHIAGPPVIDLTTGIQHGVTGHQGGQNSAATLTRLTFATQALNGSGDGLWAPIPLTTLRIEVRRRSDVILSWWAETIAGPDDRPLPGGVANRDTWISYWVGTPGFTQVSRSSVAPRSAFGFDNSIPYMVQPDAPYEFSGWNDSEGTVVVNRWSDNIVAPVTVGLSAWGRVSRTAILNWGVTIESYT